MQRKTVVIFISLFFLMENIFAQTINAEKEVLFTIPLGTGDGQMYYYCGPGGDYIEAPGGINITDKGEIVIQYNSVVINEDGSLGKKLRTNSISFKNKAFKVSLENRFINTYGGLCGQSFNGIGIDPVTLNIRYIKNDIFYPVELSYDEIIPKSSVVYEFIPVEKGLIVDRAYSSINPTIIGVEVKNGKQSKIIPFEQLNEWLKTQKGNYEVKEDGKLYKNGIIYSRKVIRKVRGMVARLKSGHCVCPTSENELNTIEKFLITRPTGEIELEIEIPWAFNRSEQEGCFYDWSFGNYGEMYALCAPLAQSLDQPYNGNFTKGNAELIAVRNYLKYFGILNDDRIRLRKGPGTNTESLGTYPIKTGFRILENSGVKQTIDGVTAEWIKVRLLDGTEGYFYGQYVQNLYDGPGTPLPWPNVPDWD